MSTPARTSRASADPIGVYHLSEGRYAHELLEPLGLGPDRFFEAHRPGGQFAGGIPRGATDQGPKACDQLLGLERLGDIIVRARVQPRHLVRPAVARGQHQHGHHAPFLAPAVEHRQPVNLGQAEVDDGDVGRIFFGHEVAIGAVCGRVNGEPGAFHHFNDLLAQCHIVFYDQSSHIDPLSLVQWLIAM